MRRIYFFLVACALLSGTAWAQTGTVQGTVTNEAGRLLYVSMWCPPKDTCIYLEPFSIKPGKFTFTGQVWDDASGKPIPYSIIYTDFSYTDSADVTLKGCCKTVVADSLGRFVIPDLWPGEYYLEVSRARNESGRASAFFVTIADSLYRADIHLSRRE